MGCFYEIGETSHVGINAQNESACYVHLNELYADRLTSFHQNGTVQVTDLS